ncbi:MAG: hypothetical protein ABI983_00720 [Acidobacteriota bacterium]
MTPSAARKTLLVSNDTPFVRDRFKSALDAAGHRALVVKSVAQLLMHARADFDEIDLIVLDLRMLQCIGRGPDQAYPQAGQRAAADPGVQR